MQVKTAELKNRLSHYLKLVSRDGERITVLDRQTPIAEIIPLAPIQAPPPPTIWELRAAFEAQHGPLDEDFELPERSPTRLRDPFADEA